MGGPHHIQEIRRQMTRQEWLDQLIEPQIRSLLREQPPDADEMRPLVEERAWLLNHDRGLVSGLTADEASRAVQAADGALS